MKKLILSTTLLFAGAISVLAQGTVAVVDFSNAPWEAWPEPTPPDRAIYVGSVAPGNAVPSAEWTAALFELRGSTWTKLGDSIPFFGAGLEGIVNQDFIKRELSVAPLVQTRLQIRVYDGSGAELPPATAGANEFNYTMAVSTPIASPTDTLMVNMRAFAVVPEPSTIALGVLGLGALLLFRRRK
jgi:hypothetical protein